MKVIIRNVIVFLFGLIASLSYAGTWSDNFSGEVLDPSWRGDRDNFVIVDNTLSGRNAHPILLVPLRWIEVGSDWDNYVVECRINVVTPNLLVCTKGALILRHHDNEGYVFALHVATKTIEVYQLSDSEILLSKPSSLELEKWYLVKVELQGDTMSFYLDGELVGKITDTRSTSGSVGLGVQDALVVLFDNFNVTGPKIEDHGSADVKAQQKISVTWGSLKDVKK